MSLSQTGKPNTAKQKKDALSPQSTHVYSSLFTKTIWAWYIPCADTPFLKSVLIIAIQCSTGNIVLRIGDINIFRHWMDGNSIRYLDVFLCSVGYKAIPDYFFVRISITP